MKILLVGNYSKNYQQSMHRFADLLCRILRDAGNDVALLRPRVILGRFAGTFPRAAKWLGYGDYLLLFPFWLWIKARSFDVVHLCDHANAVYLPWLRGRPSVVTCHDMLAIRLARGELTQQRTGRLGRLYQRWILRSLRTAHVVACVSTQTMVECERLTQLDPLCFKVIPNAMDRRFSPMPADEAALLLRGCGIQDEPFIFHVGNNSWYKNKPYVVELFAKLRTFAPYANHRLVMAGLPMQPEVERAAVRLGVRQYIVETGTVDDRTLRALYSSADFLLFPSIQEGFGWPIVEAQACDCPVVTTNAAPMNAVGGSAAAYIPLDAVSQAAEAIVLGLKNRGCMVLSGRQNAALFSEEAMVAGYMAAYRQAVEAHVRRTGTVTSRETP